MKRNSPAAGTTSVEPSSRCDLDLGERVVDRGTADDGHPVDDVDVVCASDLLDQVVGHALHQARATDEQRDLPGVLCEVQGSLAGGVAAADDEHRPARHGGASVTAAPW
jgi:hypothetical protein